jgi:CheY-like chemotaxis protein
VKTVLIVEDNEDNRLIYSQYLTHGGFRVLEATNGAEGIEVARRERPDLVLMDISMPVMDGLTATRLLKADGELQVRRHALHDAHRARLPPPASGNRTSCSFAEWRGRCWPPSSSRAESPP